MAIQKNANKKFLVLSIGVALIAVLLLFIQGCVKEEAEAITEEELAQLKADYEAQITNLQKQLNETQPITEELKSVILKLEKWQPYLEEQAKLEPESYAAQKVHDQELYRLIGDIDPSLQPIMDRALTVLDKLEEWEADEPSDDASEAEWNTWLDEGDVLLDEFADKWELYEIAMYKSLLNDIKAVTAVA